MVRRRKTGSSKANGSKKPRVNKKDASLKRWETREDIPLDDEEQFHVERDKILLEGEDEWDDDGLGDQNEVFGLKGLDESSDDENEGESGSQDEYSEDMDDAKSAPSKVKSSSASKAASKTKDESEEEDDEGWGRKQAAYYVDGQEDVSEEDEEELEKMEEEEARRLQRKARELIAEEDYGLDFARHLDAEVEEEDLLKELDHVPSTSAVPLKTKPVLLKELERSDPAALALARDWETVAEDVVRIETALKSRELDDPALGLMHLHYQTLLTYATTLAFYLHMRASPTYAARPDLLTSHPIMARLLTLKTGVAELEGLGFSALEERDEDDSEGDDESELDPEELDAMMVRLGVDEKQVARMQQLGGGMSQREVLELLMDAALEEEGDGEGESGEEDEEEPVLRQPKATKGKKGGTASGAKMNGKDAGRHDKAKTPNGKVPPQEPVYDLVEPTFESSNKKSKASSRTSTTFSVESLDFSEPTTLDEADAADKASRTKALQFHTSKIAKKSGKKQKDRRAMGGDDDLPYADSRRTGKEAQKQADEEAESFEAANQIPLVEGKRRAWGEPKAASAPVEEWAGLESADKGKKRAREADDDREGGDEQPTTEYLELVKSAKKRKKEEKQAAYDAKDEEKRITNETDSADGPRMLSRDIARNKGLTRQRGNPKNNVANPRVKKRQQYEKAKKKLASSKPVYKGGLNALGG
ncbi:hypothetical protein FRB90_005431, partial [Tulasnella sp. 427]